MKAELDELAVNQEKVKKKLCNYLERQTDIKWHAIYKYDSHWGSHLEVGIYERNLNNIKYFEYSKVANFLDAHSNMSKEGIIEQFK